MNHPWAGLAVPFEPAALVHIVDDDVAFRTSLAFLLDTAGLASRHYPDAIAFLQSLPTGHGCVVLDLAMC
jgi:FixJ family two-component response regulator